MDSLLILQDKTDALIKKHQTVVAENKKLRALIDGQNKVIQKLNKKVSHLENNAVSVNLNQTGMNDEEKDDMKRQLDAVIGEIDKILLTLND